MLFCPILTVLQSDVDLQKMRAWKRELAAQLVGWQWVFRWCANQVNSKNDAPFPFIILAQSPYTHRYFVGAHVLPKKRWLCWNGWKTTADYIIWPNHQAMTPSFSTKSIVFLSGIGQWQMMMVWCLSVKLIVNALYSVGLPFSPLRLISISKTV